MPYRQIVPTIELIWRWLVVMYEPVIAYTIAGATALMAAGAGQDGYWLGSVHPMEALGFAMGTVIDLAARGRVYGAMPPEQRKSRYREWKERLLWAAIGLGTGAVLAYSINEALAVALPAFSTSFAPVVNLVCVGVIALPFIDGARGLARLVSGQSTQEAFAGLVISWLFRRAGQTPPTNQGGQGDG